VHNGPRLIVLKYIQGQSVTTIVAFYIIDAGIAATAMPVRLGRLFINDVVIGTLACTRLPIRVDYRDR
jgi:hypothetical protein